MTSWADRLSLPAFRLGWRVVRLLPAGAAYRLFEAIAHLTHRRDGMQAQRLRENYRQVRPELTPSELDALTLAGLRSYLRYWCEVFRLPDLGPQDLLVMVRTVGDDVPRDTLAQGRGVVLFLGHLGNWDTCGAWATHHFAAVTTVAERLRPEELYAQFLAYRERLGMRILPLTGGDAVFRELVRTVRSGGCVPLLADRDLTAGGVEVDFCGHRARMAAGPAALALASGCPLHPVSVHYEPHPQRRPGPAAYRVVISFGPALTAAPGTRREQVQDLTQQCADHLAASVREHTEDWHMMQRVFVRAGEVVS
jgi:KDO2-lipid IV(A) lauroyltransferase